MTTKNDHAFEELTCVRRLFLFSVQMLFVYVYSALRTIFIRKYYVGLEISPEYHKVKLSHELEFV